MNYCIIKTYLIFFNESNESSPFDLNRLSGAVVERHDEVKEIALAQVRGRLLFEVRPAHTYAAAKDKIS